VERGGGEEEEGGGGGKEVAGYNETQLQRGGREGREGRKRGTGSF
jgi:hypothetical protein